MKILDFKLEHLNLMSIRDHEKELLETNLFGNRLRLLENEVSHTLVIDDRVIMVGGSIEISEGVYDIWQIPSTYVHNHMVNYSRSIKKWFDGLCNIEGVIRIQSVALNDELHERWMLFLGLEKEGIFRKYCMSKDYAMWSMINGC